MSKDVSQNDSLASGRNYETSDARFGALLRSALALTVVAAFAFVAITVLFNFLQDRRESAAVPRSPLAEGRQIPPEPRLQVSPELDLEQLKATSDSLLNSYGWVVREAGVARIPVERAMTLIIERGLPVRSQNRESNVQDQMRP